MERHCIGNPGRRTQGCTRQVLSGSSPVDAGFDYTLRFELITVDDNSYMLFFATKHEHSGSSA